MHLTQVSQHQDIRRRRYELRIADGLNVQTGGRTSNRKAPPFPMGLECWTPLQNLTPEDMPPLKGRRNSSRISQK
jgi:hypothetical protein